MSVDSCNDHSEYMVHCKKCQNKVKELTKPEGMSLHLYRRYLEELIQATDENVDYAIKRLNLLETQYAVQKEAVRLIQEHHYELIYTLKRCPKK